MNPETIAKICYVVFEIVRDLVIDKLSGKGGNS